MMKKTHVFYSGHQITEFMELQRITGVLIDHFDKEIYSESLNQWRMCLHILMIICQKMKKR